MISYLIYRLGQAIALSLPLKLAYAFAIFISRLHYLFAKDDRKAVRGNLKAIFPEKTIKEIALIHKAMCANFAKYLVDFFRFEKLDKEFIKKNIQLENINYFDEALKKGKGVIVLTAHLGNWELGGVATALCGHPLWVVALPHKDKLVDNFFNSQRESKGIKVMPLGKAARISFNVLKTNQMLALVGDRDFTQKGIAVEFFGKQAIFPQGPAAFALKTGAPIVPGFMLRNKDDSFTLRVEKPIEFTPTGNNEADSISIITIYKKIFEEYIRNYPDQWYMFRKFWI